MDLFDSMCRRNPELIRAAATLHQTGQIPPDCYVADLDTIMRNAVLVSEAAAKAGLHTYFESKQFGRSPIICTALQGVRFDTAIAIDMEELYTLERLHVRVGHVGHLGQVPRADVPHVVTVTRPDYITVYSYEKAAQIASAASRIGRTQKLLLRVNGPDDAVPLNIAGGTPEHEALDLVERIERLNGVSFAGVTTYPGVRFDLERQEWVLTPNFETMIRFASNVKERFGLDVEHINPAGNNCVESMHLIAAAGATYCEPGQAFVGGLVANAFSDQPEIPAIAYVSEVSHIIGGVPYVYASSMVANNTIGIWNPLHYDALGASLSRPGVDPLESRASSHPQVFSASDPTAFMYNAIRPHSGLEARVDDTVIFGFRTQLYRSNGGRLAVVEGIQRGEAHVLGFSDRNGVSLADRVGTFEPSQHPTLTSGKVLA